jgi:hypothetical protein
VVLLVDGAYAVGGTRRDPAAARHAKAAVAALLAGRLVADRLNARSRPRTPRAAPRARD